MSGSALIRAIQPRLALDGAPYRLTVFFYKQAAFDIGFPDQCRVPLNQKARPKVKGNGTASQPRTRLQFESFLLLLFRLHGLREPFFGAVPAIEISSFGHDV